MDNEVEVVERWDRLRKSMLASIMVDTHLRTLASDLDTSPWPLAGEDETPAKYVYFSLSQLSQEPEFVVNNERIALLMEIFDATLSMDDPFNEMTQTLEERNAGHYTFDDVLQRLAIPGDFPVTLMRLPREIMELVANFGVETLTDFIGLCQNMAQKIHLKGDLRHYVNALVSGEAESIATFLPYRVGYQGLYLPETIGLMVKGFDEDQRWVVLRKFGIKLSTEQNKQLSIYSKEDVEELMDEIRQKMDLAVSFFPEQKAEAVNVSCSKRDLMRYFIFLNDLEAENIAALLMQDYFGESARGQSSRAERTEKKAASGNFSQRIFSMLSKIKK